jgi:NTP pyrophosphatase (non-canonical NTP hydrolase)
MQHILNEIKNERERQNNKFGVQNHTPMHWIPILTEEIGEAAKEALEHHFEYKPKSGGKVTPEIQQARLMRYRKELIEVAAVAVSMVQSLERNELSAVAEIGIHDARELIKQISEPQEGIIILAHRRGTYLSKPLDMLHDEVKNLVKMHILECNTNLTSSDLSAPKEYYLTITGRHLAAELILDQ